MTDKYDKMEEYELFGGGILVSKYVRYNDQVADLLWKALQESEYTKGELAERLEWDLHKLMMVLSGDDTIDIYDMVHVAGALGYHWKFNLAEGLDDGVPS